MNYVCNICSSKFDTKQHLNQHQTKKNKCNIKTAYHCNECNKYFKHNKSLINHSTKCEKQIIINNNIDDNKNLIIKNFLISSMEEDTKIKLIQKYNMSLQYAEIKAIINSDISIDGKILSLTYNIKEPNNINNSTINNGTINTENSNNVTNNIQINNFGQEKIDYLDKEYFKNLIMNQHIEKGYIQLIKDIYLNKEHPENKTVKVENINNKYALVFNNDKWDTMLKADLKEMLHKKNYTILKMHYNKLKKSMSVPKREETITFLSRDDTGDPHMMYVIDKIILLFYNDGEVDDIPEKYKINKNI